MTMNDKIRAALLPPELAAEYEGYSSFVNDEYDMLRGEEYGSFEVFYVDYGINVERLDDEKRYRVPASMTRGWYWWAAFPGCIPDGDASGPFATSQEAYDDARE